MGGDRRTPRSVPGLIGECLQLYGRFPLLFPALAAGVLAPYVLVVLAVTGTGPLNRGSLDFLTSNLLLAIEWVFVDSLISAMHVHAVIEIEEGRKPRLAEVAKKGLRAMPTVAAAAAMSGLAIFGGFLLLVIPGAYLWLRWQVVAQAAAIEQNGWRVALRRSWSLTEKNVLRVLLFLVSILALSFVTTFVVGLPFRHHYTTVVAFVVGLSIQTVVISFTALATALLYLDLRARREILATNWSGESPDLPEQPDRHPDPRLDPRTSDETRAARRVPPS